jgi:hypothetical protein
MFRGGIVFIIVILFVQLISFLYHNGWDVDVAGFIPPLNRGIVPPLTRGMAFPVEHNEADFFLKIIYATTEIDI